MILLLISFLRNGALSCIALLKDVKTAMVQEIDRQRITCAQEKDCECRTDGAKEKNGEKALAWPEGSEHTKPRQSSDERCCRVQRKCLALSGTARATGLSQVPAPLAPAVRGQSSHSILLLFSRSCASLEPRPLGLRHAHTAACWYPPLHLTGKTSPLSPRAHLAPLVQLHLISNTFGGLIGSIKADGNLCRASPSGTD